jgi:hypothetical protein
MATADYPLFDKVEGASKYVLIVLGALYLLKLVLGLSFSFGFSF